MRIQNTGCKIQDTKYRIQACPDLTRADRRVGRVRDTEYTMQDTQYSPRQGLRERRFSLAEASENVGIIHYSLFLIN